jgi:hypothetical protein
MIPKFRVTVVDSNGFRVAMTNEMQLSDANDYMKTIKNDMRSSGYSCMENVRIDEVIE